MKKYVCAVCGYTYDEATGAPDAGVAPGTKWENLPDDWQCPICGAPKSVFEPQRANTHAELAPTLAAISEAELGPTDKYVCAVCGYVYDEAAGAPDVGIAPGTKWEDLPDEWRCPICGAPKSVFEAQQAKTHAEPAPAPTAIPEGVETLRELTIGELSVLCSNLARGCEKQYLAEESALFAQLADYFSARTPAEPESGAAALLELVQQDLEHNFPAANVAAAQSPDRGAQRALVWSEKVSRILNALLARYEMEGDSFIKTTNIYVCEICGFVYVGDTPPEFCPVCKVPGWKIAKVERR